MKALQKLRSGADFQKIKWNDRKKKKMAKMFGSPIAICMTVNLKYGWGGRTKLATTKPMREPNIVERSTLTGINHLVTDEVYQYITTTC